MPGGDPRPPGGRVAQSNEPVSFVSTAIHNIQLALDDPRTPEKARPELLAAWSYLERV